VKYTRPKTNKQEATTMVQHNRLLKKGPYNYSKAFGVKTGYTSLAHHTFVGAAQQDGRTLIAVILNAKESGDTFQDAINLFDAAFKESKVERTLVAQGPQKMTSQLAGASKPIHTYVNKPISIQYYPAEEPQLKAIVAWQKNELPVSKDEQIGKVQILSTDGKVVYETPLFAAEDASTSWGYRLKNLFGGYGMIIGIIIVGALVTGLFVVMKKR
jgi:D-alanyl-D-alanine carboxypeptidase (penicillin-binding protein 5/6)